MRKHIFFTMLIVVLLLFSSCQTELSIPYMQPSNVNMASYRSVAVASTSLYNGKESVPRYIRYIDDIFDPSIAFYFDSTYSYDKINKLAAKEITKMVSNVFTSSSYYSTISTERTDDYIELYKRIGSDPSAKLAEDGIDALIVPRITSLTTDEYIDTDLVEDRYTGEIDYRYTLYRYVNISFSITVLDTRTNRIVSQKTYSTENTDWEVFDPNYFVFYSILSEEDLVYNAIINKLSEVVSDYVPTKRSIYVTLKDNKPKNESVEPAYKAADEGNLDYALTLFKNAWESSSHVPSGYNAALIMASSGDIDSAIEILDDIRGRGLDDKEVNKFYSRLLEIKKKNEEANEQLKPVSDQSSVSPYSYLF